MKIVLDKFWRILRGKNFLVSLLAVIVLVSSVHWRLNYPAFFQSLQDITFDSYQRIKPRTQTPTPIRIIDIDDASLKRFGQWPWPRTRVSKMIEQLSDLGAAAIAFDVVFAERDRTTGSELIRQLDEINWPDREKLRPVLDSLPDNDRMLAFAMGKAPVILGFFSLPPSISSDEPNNMPEIKGKFAFGGGDPTDLLIEIKNSISSLDILEDSASGIGLASTSPTIRDDVIRRVPLFIGDGKSIYPSLSLETLRVAQGASTFIIKTTAASGEIDSGKRAVTQAKVGQFSFPMTEKGEFNVYFAKEQDERYISAYEITANDNEKIRKLIEGHIVLIGTSAVGLEDLRSSSLGDTIPGVSVHAQIIDQILTGTFLSRPDWADGAEVAMAALVSLLLVAILPFVGALFSAVIGGVLAITIIGTSWYAFSEKGMLLDPVYPTMVALTIFLLITLLQFAISEREKRFVRSAFQRYLAPDLLHKLEQTPDSLKLGGEIRDLTLMFMDIRGFTPISEKLEPQELVAFLNKLLSPLSETIQEHEGAIDKYIGDSIMAFWNAPLDVDDHPRKAALAALEMLENLERLNEDDAFEFHSERYNLGDVEIGIGLNTGEGCVGNMGSTNRFDYSVIGDTVNVAARIESSCKGVGWPLLLSESTANACEGFAMLKAGIVELKGKSEPAPLYALIGDETFARTNSFKEIRKCHMNLVSELEKKNWKNGGDSVRALIDKCSKTTPAAYEKLYKQMKQTYC